MKNKTILTYIPLGQKDDHQKQKFNLNEPNQEQYNNQIVIQLVLYF